MSVDAIRQKGKREKQFERHRRTIVQIRIENNSDNDVDWAIGHLII